MASLNGLGSINGLSSANGLSSLNGLSSANGLSSLNGLTSINGLSSANGLITADGQATLSYIVRCALPAGHTINLKDANNNPIPFTGEMGMAPEWENHACGTDCQQQISACVLAHVNTSGVHISLWMDGDSPALGWGQNAAYPYQEGSFFGNIFTSTPTMYYCNGKDFAVGTVPGRIGANGTTGPYTNPFNSGKGYCKDACVPQDIPNQNDGYKACKGFNHVVTVWRNVDTSANVAGSSAAFDPAMDYKVCNRSSGMCLDVAGGSTSDYAAHRSEPLLLVVHQHALEHHPGLDRQVQVHQQEERQGHGHQRWLDRHGAQLIQYTYSGNREPTVDLHPHRRRLLQVQPRQQLRLRPR